MTGWECPKCHCVYAPFVLECARCNGLASSPPYTTDRPVLFPTLCTCVTNPYVACPVHMITRPITSGSQCTCHTSSNLPCAVHSGAYTK